MLCQQISDSEPQSKSFGTASARPNISLIASRNLKCPLMTQSGPFSRLAKNLLCLWLA